MSDSVREAFEKWWNEPPAQVDINSNQGEAAWLTWKAATAAADAEWRGVVERLALIAKATREEAISQWNPEASKRVAQVVSIIDEALAQAAELLGRK